MHALLSGCISALQAVRAVPQLLPAIAAAAAIPAANPAQASSGQAAGAAGGARAVHAKCEPPALCAQPSAPSQFQASAAALVSVHEIFNAPHMPHRSPYAGRSIWSGEPQHSAAIRRRSRPPTCSARRRSRRPTAAAAPGGAGRRRALTAAAASCAPSTPRRLRARSGGPGARAARTCQGSDPRAASWASSGRVPAARAARMCQGSSCRVHAWAQNLGCRSWEWSGLAARGYASRAVGVVSACIS